MGEVLSPGNVVVVTGAGSGIGQALAVRFSELGMRAAVVDVDEAALAGTLDMLPGSGHVAETADVRDFATVDAFADRVYSSLGPVHLLCNNAGMVGTFGQPVWEVEPDDWARVMSVNLIGVANGVRAFVPRMLSSGLPAHVLNTASIAGLTIPSPSISPTYNASKHAVIALTDTLRLHLDERGADIGVTALCPGPVATNILQNSFEMRRGTAAPDMQQIAHARDEQSTGHDATGSDTLSPRAVAEAAEAAIRAGDPYCFTHGDAEDLIRERFSFILSEHR